MSEHGIIPTFLRSLIRVSTRLSAREFLQWMACAGRLLRTDTGTLHEFLGPGTTALTKASPAVRTALLQTIGSTVAGRGRLRRAGLTSAISIAGSSNADTAVVALNESVRLGRSSLDFGCDFLEQSARLLAYAEKGEIDFSIAHTAFDLLESFSPETAERLFALTVEQLLNSDVNFRGKADLYEQLTNATVTLAATDAPSAGEFFLSGLFFLKSTTPAAVERWIDLNRFLASR